MGVSEFVAQRNSRCEYPGHRQLGDRCAALRGRPTHPEGNNRFARACPRLGEAADPGHRSPARKLRGAVTTDLSGTAAASASR